MIDIQSHTKSDYAVLPDIDSPAMKPLDDDDWACLDEVGELLIARGANDRFGVTLLHSHFPVRDDELMVETVDQGERILTLRPIGAHAKDGEDYAAINLQFGRDRDDRDFAMIGLEFVRLDALGTVAPVSAEDAPVLGEVKVILARRNLLQRFGVGLLHDALGLDESEILLETCDQLIRSLRCVAAGRKDERAMTSVETSWSWSTPAETGRDEMQAARLCRRQCTKICYTPQGSSHQSGPHDPSGHEVEPD